MKVNFATHTKGKSEFCHEDREVHINDLKFGFRSTDIYPDSPFVGELRAYFDPNGYTYGSWNTDGHGFICGNKAWLTSFKKELRSIGLSIVAVRDVKYSEKDRHGADYVSLDIGENFNKSWKRLLKAKKVFE